MSARVWKVGDVVRGSEYETLPVGAVLGRGQGVECEIVESGARFFRSSKTYPCREMFEPRVILSLPPGYGAAAPTPDVDALRAQVAALTKERDEAREQVAKLRDEHDVARRGSYRVREMELQIEDQKEVIRGLNARIKALDDQCKSAETRAAIARTEADKARRVADERNHRLVEVTRDAEFARAFRAFLRGD